MKPNIPPNLFRVIDTTGLDQQLQEIFVLRQTFERVGHSRAWKAFEDFKAITLETRVTSDPEGRAGRDRIKMWEKIAHLVHHMDGDAAVRNSHMNVQAKDQVGSRDLLHVFDNLGVAFAFGNILVE